MLVSRFAVIVINIAEETPVYGQFSPEPLDAESAKIIGLTVTLLACLLFGVIVVLDILTLTSKSFRNRRRILQRSQ